MDRKQIEEVVCNLIEDYLLSWGVRVMCSNSDVAAMAYDTVSVVLEMVEDKEVE